MHNSARTAFMKFTISGGGQNHQKPYKIGSNRHVPYKTPNSYNSNISECINPIKLKFEAQAGTKRC